MAAALDLFDRQLESVALASTNDDRPVVDDQFGIHVIAFSVKGDILAIGSAHDPPLG
jgi:hypothetical protein